MSGLISHWLIFGYFKKAVFNQVVDILHCGIKIDVATVLLHYGVVIIVNHFPLTISLLQQPYMQQYLYSYSTVDSFELYTQGI